MSFKTLAIIPARGGSKSIPRKNVRPLAGKPLIAYTIEAAVQAQSVNRVVVSTDDSEIAEVSKKYGAEIVRRPDEISGDTASSESALLHSLEHLKQSENYEPDFVVFIQCTSPLILSEDIDGIFQTFLNEQADSAQTVVPFHGFIWEKDSEGNAVGINHDKSKRLRRQDIAPQYQETGAIYVMKTEGFLKAKNRFFGKTAMHIIPLERAIEINDLAEFNVAEVMVQQRENPANNPTHIKGE